MFNKISNIDVLYNFLTSDHFVLSVKLDNVSAKQLCNPCDDPTKGFNIMHIKLDQLNHDTLSKCTASADLLLCESHFSCDVVYCSGGENCNEHHGQDLVSLYERITRKLRSADEITIPQKIKKQFYTGSRLEWATWRTIQWSTKCLFSLV